MRKNKKVLMEQKFVPIFVKDDFDAVFLAECSVAAGYRAIEITCRRDNVVDEIKCVKSAFPDLVVMVGSIVDDGPMLDKIKQQRPDFPSIEQLLDLGIDGLVCAMPLK